MNQVREVFNTVLLFRESTVNEDLDISVVILKPRRTTFTTTAFRNLLDETENWIVSV